MKKCLLSLMAVGLMATVANAATIGLRWDDTPDAKHIGAGTLELYLDLVTGDVVSGAGGDVVCIQGDCTNLRFNNATSGLPGPNPTWSFPQLGTQIQVASPTFAGVAAGAQTAADNLSGVQSVVLGTIDVSFTGEADASQKGFGIDFFGAPSGVVDAGAVKLTWDARYNTSYSGYIAYGNYGNPGWGTKPSKGQQTVANPLLITKTPEPTSLALVALGGFALLRRRR